MIRNIPLIQTHIPKIFKAKQWQNEFIIFKKEDYYFHSNVSLSPTDVLSISIYSFSLYVSRYLSISSLSLSIYAPLSPTRWESVSFSIYLFLSIYIYLSIYLYVCFYFSSSLSLSIFSIYFSLFLFIYLSIYLSVPICLSLLSIYISIYFSLI